MISAGTVAAYLTLDSTHFTIGIKNAMNLLSSLYTSGENGAAGIGLIESAVHFAAGALNGGLAGALGAAAYNAERSGDTISAAMLGTASSVVSNISNAAQSTHSAGEFMSQVISGTADAFRLNFGKITSGCSTNRDKIAAIFSSIANSASVHMRSTSGSIGLISAAQGPARIAASGIASAITGQLSPLRSKTSSIMASVGDGMVSGLASKAAAITSKARSIANSVAATMRAALKIASPSRVMREIGAQTGEGMALGLSDMQPEVARRSYELASGAISAASSVSPAVSVPRISAPAASGVGDIPAAGSAHGDGIDRLDEISRRLDALLGYITRTEQIMQVDGRTFGRLVREYV